MRRRWFVEVMGVFGLGIPRVLGPKEHVLISMTLESAKYLNRCILENQPVGGNSLADSILIGVELAIFDANQPQIRLRQDP